MKAFIVKIVLLLFILISLTSARKVKFSVVSIGSNKVKVAIGNNKYKLSKINSYTPVYQAVIDIENTTVSYKYIADGVSESFTRTLSKGLTTTYNEFYGRKYTIKSIPQLPTIGTWTKSIGKGELFDDSYIPTVHITAKDEIIFTSKKPIVTNFDNIVFVLKDNIYSFNNTSAVGKNYNWRKNQFKVLLGNNGIQGRYVFKFRDNNEDPTFMRQDLYGDIMNAIGCPTIQSVKTRVYINNKPVGYYILQEEAGSTSFVRSAFHGDNNGNLLIKKTKKLGYVQDASTGADFYYTGNSFKSFKKIDTGNGDNSRIKELAKAFEKLNINNDNEIKKFEKNWFDIDTFLKAIAMQYLTASYDSYWFFSSNFALYDNPTESKNGCYKFYFICQDWDATFGVNANPIYFQNHEDFIKRSYKDYVNKSWNSGDIYESKQRYAIDKLLSNSTIKARFESILKNIVSKIFNPVVISKRLDALVERHREEVLWNYDVIKNKPISKRSQKYYWTIEDFDDNINEPVGNGSSYGIKQYIYLRAKAIKEEFGINVNLGNIEYEEPNITGECGPSKGKCPRGQCCSQYGYCGSETSHCGIGCQPAYGICSAETIKTITKISTTTIKIKTSTKANDIKTKTKTKSSTVAVNIKNSTKTSSIKSKTKTKNSTTTKISTDGTCGKTKGRCPNNECCSQYGYCGSTPEYCSNGCQKNYGLCN
eukprot:jgi/Orpsp1_1/1176226/evm.model.c7180000056867.1